MTGMTILLASAGRRPYLVRWFIDAFELLGVDGRVILTDVDGNAPARAFATVFLPAPPVASSDYSTWLDETLRREGVDIAISVNDFELSTWARLGADRKWDALVRLSPEAQSLIEDKFAMADLLKEHSIASPELIALHELTALDDRPLVLKGRYGSGSRGLRIGPGRDLLRLLPEALSEVTQSDGTSAASYADPAEVLICQELIRGQEYGLDVICDLREQFVAVLVRKKLAMRAGETDRAVTVEPAAFESLGRRLAKAIPHRGVIDVDVIVDSAGRAWVIDVNPRFGGGYPFSHVAGANVPAALVGWMSGSSMIDSFMDYQAEVVGSKSVEIVRLP